MCITEVLLDNWDAWFRNRWAELVLKTSKSSLHPSSTFFLLLILGESLLYSLNSLLGLGDFKGLTLCGCVEGEQMAGEAVKGWKVCEQGGGWCPPLKWNLLDDCHKWIAKVNDIQYCVLFKKRKSSHEKSSNKSLMNSFSLSTLGVDDVLETNYRKPIYQYLSDYQYQKIKIFNLF